LEHGENTARRIAGLEPVGEWVLKEILLCALFVGFQGIVENWLEVGRCGSRVNVRHDGISEELEKDVSSWMDREERHCLTNVHLRHITDKRHDSRRSYCIDIVRYARRHRAGYESYDQVRMNCGNSTRFIFTSLPCLRTHLPRSPFHARPQTSD
jgi:hypothetical protein